MAKDCGCISDIELICLDQALEGCEMILDHILGLVQFIDLLGRFRERGDEQNSTSSFQPSFQCRSIDLAVIEQPIQRLLLIHDQIDIFKETEHAASISRFSA